MLVGELSLKELLREAASYVEALVLAVLLDDLGHDAPEPGRREEGREDGRVVLDLLGEPGDDQLL